MVRESLRRRENVAGDIFVDSTCIDCDTCRWMSPDVFARVGGMSAVVRQPKDPGSRRHALEALVSCPTASIGTVTKAADLRSVGFPIPVAGAVHHCGYHAESSFGATSYLIRRPDGNVLVDSPRFAAPLVRRLEALGGVAWLVLTHRDDVADHAKFARHFGLRRLVHGLDARGLDGVETFAGTEPFEVLPGLTAIPTPGHTAGHACFRWQDPSGERFLFTGDHLAYDDGAGHLEAWPDVCWHDWGEQTRSMERLVQHPFEWALPGHGRRGHMPWPQMEAELRRLVGWMERQA
ncbi:MAG: MBL fold metallo-hydrolase [Thermoplasmatota archaeon]